MRVRPNRENTTTRRVLGPSRRSHARRKPADAGQPPELPPEPSIMADDLLFDESRARASGGPVDVAHYTCQCGFTFDAAVSTTVTCPNCGAGQAW